MADTQIMPNDTNGGTVDQKIDRLAIAVKAGFDSVDKRLDALEEKTTRIEATMVTKTYLDDKLADLKGDLIVKMRKLDGHLAFIEDLLKSRAVLSDADVTRARKEFQIFPTLAA
ncbi:MAG: hypothetical protein V1723_03185 [Candidatus Uhrbacteria bacterium]